jgi:hypothetical protein
MTAFSPATTLLLILFVYPTNILCSTEGSKDHGTPVHKGTKAHLEQTFNIPRTSSPGDARHPEADEV